MEAKSQLWMALKSEVCDRKEWEFKFAINNGGVSFQDKMVPYLLPGRLLKSSFPYQAWALNADILHNFQLLGNLQHFKSENIS